MSPPVGEPATEAEIRAWVTERGRASDPFEHVRAASEEHRGEHGPGCTVYPTSHASLLGVLAATAGARRILEIGTGIGYSALWLAYGSSAAGGTVQTIEQDAEHTRLAREHADREGFTGQIEVIEGELTTALDPLTGPYDLVFYDGHPADTLVFLPHAFRLLDPGGLLISSNLFLAVHDPQLPGLDQAAAYRDRITEDPRLLTSFLPSGLAVSIRIA